MSSRVHLRADLVNCHGFGNCPASCASHELRLAVLASWSEILWRSRQHSCSSVLSDRPRSSDREGIPGCSLVYGDPPGIRRSLSSSLHCRVAAGGTVTGRTWHVLTAALIVAFSVAPGSSAPEAVEPHASLRKYFRIDPNDLKALDGGRIIARVEMADDRDVLIVGAVRLRASRADVVAGFGDVHAYRQTTTGDFMYWSKADARALMKPRIRKGLEKTLAIAKARLERSPTLHRMQR